MAGGALIFLQFPPLLAGGVSKFALERGGTVPFLGGVGGGVGLPMRDL